MIIILNSIMRNRRFGKARFLFLLFSTYYPYFSPNCKILFMYIQPELEERMQLFTETRQQHMGDTLGIAFTSIKKDEIIAEMPVSKHTIQPFGILHGGASVVLAETLASVGAWLNLEGDAKTAVGIEINANHIRSVKKGASVTGVARPVKKGRSIHVWEVRITTPDEKLVCTSRCTLAIVGN